MTINEYTQAFSKAVNSLGNTLEKELENSKEDILSLNKDQLLSGLNIDSELLSPDYLSDPYFKTPEAAQNYAKMKKKLESMHKSRRKYSNIVNFPNKPDNTPNLIVSGSFQDRMYINVSGDKFQIDSSYIDSPDIENKYHKKIFGLAKLSKEFLWNNRFKPAIANLFKSNGIKVNS